MGIALGVFLFFPLIARAPFLSLIGRVDKMDDRLDQIPERLRKILMRESCGDVASEGGKGIPEAIRAVAADAQNLVFERALYEFKENDILTG
jgi:hypothetical protein